MHTYIIYISVICAVRALNILTGKPAGKRRLGRPRRRWEEILEWTLKKWESIRGIGLIRLRIGVIGEPL